MKICSLVTSMLLLSSSLIISCKKDNNINPANTNVMNIVQQGTWRVTQYNNSGTDELYYFSGYVFTFSNGTVTAIKNTTSVTGTYSTIFDDSKHKLVLNFGITVPFNELNEDWQIIEETTIKIRLQNVSGGNGGTDLLTFERN